MDVKKILQSSWNLWLEKKKNNQGVCQALCVWKFDESVVRVAFYQERAGWLVVENLWAEVFTYNFASESQFCESTDWSHQLS